MAQPRRRQDPPPIQRTPGVCGGEACIRTTRIPVYLLEAYRRQGLDEARLLEFYPDLTRDDLRAAWAYVAAHPQEIEQAIEESETG